MLQDEDSLMSAPSSFDQTTDEKSELLKILEEVTSSSSSEESEEEISKWGEGGRAEEVGRT